MPAKSSCKCCNQLCDAHLLVTCCVCKERYKHSCVEITTNEVRTLNANKGYDWTCVNCRTIGKDLNDLKALIIQLQSDIQELKTENMRMAGSSSVDFEEIISEINERQKRTNNIIIFNIDEPDHSISVREQIEADKVTAVDILNQIVPDLPVASIKPVRLGLFSNTKTRPVKITFQNTDSTHKILMNANKLKNNAVYSNIRISRDRTKRQMEYYGKVRQELQDRHRAGDTNCRIKFFNDVPKIVQGN
nr:unnamed protein product [Callosobruchus chinensis]CAH7730167.1 unnamed protein product [Callosobruchus chinensis]CAH7731437.1 unnamed protein product [Callosobruchus chinensis]CAH7734104.1 unnamed protein product [Callosobruchus chinensis]CAH7746682.1 unnamed protein product [Callosobruchus chinensis]